MMIKHSFCSSILLLSLFAFSACAPSYPKEKITESVKSIIKKEYNLDGEAKLVGKTLFLDVKLPGLISTEAKTLTKVLDNVQGAVLAVTRVSLSSDADIEFLIVSAGDPSWKLNMRVIQRLEDVKGFLYQRISRSDYEDRLILEINSNEKETGRPAKTIVPEDGNEMDMHEFIGRLIVSQINMLSRNNPFLSLLLGDSKLEYLGSKDEELMISLSNYLAPKTIPLFEEIISQKSSNIIKKFTEWKPQRIKILGDKGQNILINLNSSL